MTFLEGGRGCHNDLHVHKMNRRRQGKKNSGTVLSLMFCQDLSLPILRTGTRKSIISHKIDEKAFPKKNLLYTYILALSPPLLFFVRLKHHPSSLAKKILMIFFGLKELGDPFDIGIHSLIRCSRQL